VIRLSRWTILAAGLAAVVAFLDNIIKFVGVLDRLPLPDWAVVLAQYNLEFAAIIALAAVTLTVNWHAAGERYAAYRKLWAGRKIRLRSLTVYPEELALVLSLLILVSTFSFFEIQKARTLYTSYGLAYIVRAGCNGDFAAARDRSDALAKNGLWSKYSHILQNLKDRFGLLEAIAPRRAALFGRYKDDLPSEILQSDSYEIRVLFATDLDTGARAREATKPLAKSWLESAAPCKSS
jgi:hypothetical protein